jgi:uncharacterized membrane protein YGL010W
MRVDTLVSHYSPSHRHPANLIIHAATVPLFVVSGLALLSAGSAAAHLSLWDAGFAFALALTVLYARVGLRLALVLGPVLAVGALAVHLLAAWKPWLAAMLGAAGMLIALSAQRSGHRREPVQVQFDGAWDFIRRIAREQFYVSPLFLAALATGAAPAP